MKIAIIGAGSIGFTRGIVRDILTVPEFRDTVQFAFTDISKSNLDMVAQLCRRDMDSNGVKSTLKTTTNRREALRGANYVFAVVRVGGLEGFQTDIDIPLKYGVDQAVGDCCGGSDCCGRRFVFWSLPDSWLALVRVRGGEAKGSPGRDSALRISRG